MDIKGPKFLFLYFAMLLAAGPCIAFARLGDRPQALQQRYGPPVSSAPLPGFEGLDALHAITRSQYQKLDFLVTVFFRDGHSVLEIFAKRGLSQVEARQVVMMVATHPVGGPAPGQEDHIRQAAGITCKDMVFWTWTTPALPIAAAYNPIECTLSFFSEPTLYARIQQALTAAP